MNDTKNMRKLGLIINPIAGMGGKVGLKGTDGLVEKAIELGAKPISQFRTKKVLDALRPVKNAIHLITYPKEMGENAAIEAGFKPQVIGTIKEGQTTAEDTKRAAREMKDLDVNLILFVGGDGTARDLVASINSDVPVLGIPSGVKVYSSCFSIKPRAAARITMKYLWEELPLREAEVLDINEEKYRQNKLEIKLFGQLLIPFEPTLLQASKIASPFTITEHDNQITIARHVIENFEEDVTYILGPGTTVMAITEMLGEEKTLLGVDILRNNKVIAKDVGEEEILKFIQESKKSKIIISPLGQQGMLLGRGNQQISPRVIRNVGKSNLIVLATRYKLRTIQRFRVDTQDSSLDEQLRGYVRVICDYNEIQMKKIE
ncbi:MAG: ATP-NAD kinase family protein [Candidatus Helarchaeota archaeon]